MLMFFTIFYGIRTIAPRGKLPPVRMGVWVKVGLVLGLGIHQTIDHEENGSLCLGLGFRLGLVLGMGAIVLEPFFTNDIF